MSDTKPWWFPVLCNADYCARLREDYPEEARMSDEALIDHFNEGLKYVCLWDHAGDAYEQFEPMADAFLSVLEALERLLAAAEMTTFSDQFPQECHDASEAIRKATGGE